MPRFENSAICPDLPLQDLPIANQVNFFLGLGILDLQSAVVKSALKVFMTNRNIGFLSMSFSHPRSFELISIS